MSPAAVRKMIGHSSAAGFSRNRAQTVKPS